MTYEERHSIVRDEAPVLDAQPGRPTIVREERVATVEPSASTVGSRVAVALFGVIQGLLLVRIALLLLDAQRENGVVAAILDVTRLFVAPFEGMFRTDALQAGGSVLDVPAVTALVAVTIIELVVLAVLRIPRRREDD